jgi:hypothetical protein
LRAAYTIIGEDICWFLLLEGGSEHVGRHYCGWMGGKLFYAFGWLFVIYVAWMAKHISFFLGLSTGMCR